MSSSLPQSYRVTSSHQDLDTTTNLLLYLSLSFQLDLHTLLDALSANIPPMTMTLQFVSLPTASTPTEKTPSL